MLQSEMYYVQMDTGHTILCTLISRHDILNTKPIIHYNVDSVSTIRKISVQVHFFGSVKHTSDFTFFLENPVQSIRSFVFIPRYFVTRHVLNFGHNPGCMMCYVYMYNMFRCVIDSF